MLVSSSRVGALKEPTTRSSIATPKRVPNFKLIHYPKFLTIGYGDQTGYDRTSKPVRDAAHAQDAKLQSEGALIGIAGAPVQVRNPDAAGLETRDGPFMSSALPIAGFAVIEAADLAEAVKKVSGVPCAVAHGVVEVWPLE
ncbi:MAG: YciI family protein [Aestuariivirga sp.]